MTWTPHVTVATVVEKDHQFLCVEEHASNKIVINQPAGHVENGETLPEAAIRETLEETGWHVNITHTLGIYVYSPHPASTYYRIAFRATALRHDPNVVLDEGIIQPLWLSVPELEARKNQLRSPLVMKCIGDYIDNKSYPLDLIYEWNGQ